MNNDDIKESDREVYKEISTKADIIRHGFLMKKGQVNKSWKKRWFVLYENNCLSYYEHPENTEQTALGEISLYNVLQLQYMTNANTLHLSTSNRTFKLKCEKQNEYQEWINDIKIRLNPSVIHHGYAYKRGEINTAWKKRYFQLVQYENGNKTVELKYFQSNKLEKFKGVIQCNLIHKKGILSDTDSKIYGINRQNVIVLVTKERVYYLGFDNEKEASAWLAAIQKFNAK